MLVGGLNFSNKVDMTQEMWNRKVQSEPWVLEDVPDQYKTQEMYNEAVRRQPWMPEFVPDQFVTQEMCNKAKQGDPEALRFGLACRSSWRSCKRSL